MVNAREPLINVVSSDKRKMLMTENSRTLEPKGKESGMDAHITSIADEALPAERRDLRRTGMGMERGKPVALPLGK